MTQHRDDQGPAMLDALIDAITVDANSDDERLWAFRQAFEDTIVVPCDAFVIGEPVSVRAFDYDGNERRGLTATCCRAEWCRGRGGGLRRGPCSERRWRTLPCGVPQMAGARAISARGHPFHAFTPAAHSRADRPRPQRSNRFGGAVSHGQGRALPARGERPRDHTPCEPSLHSGRRCPDTVDSLLRRWHRRRPMRSVSG
jgi:hypothetical protein